MAFYISITYDRKRIRLKVEQIAYTNELEKYRVIARNQSFVIQNNRPLLVHKELKNFPITWKVIEGGYNQPFILEQITKAIEAKIK